MRPGLLEPHTHDCSRHGTIDLFVALDVKAGTVIAKVHRRHRNMECRHFLQTIDRATPADFELHLVLDKSSTHKALDHPALHAVLGVDLQALLAGIGLVGDVLVDAAVQ